MTVDNAASPESISPQTAWFHPFNGIAGDMTLGALIHAGADEAYVRAGLDSLNVAGWELHVDRISRNGIAAVNVTVDADEGHVHRTASDISALVSAADLPLRVRERSISVFEALAVAEGEIHDMDPAKVHFHEVGGIDAIVDVVGSCLALESLGVDTVACATVTVGRSVVRSAHGPIPNPAPATVRLLEGLPVRGLDEPVELTTPTGAAIIRALATNFGGMPEMTVTASGYGAGDAELEAHPNLLQVVIGESLNSAAESAHVQTTARSLVVIETNVDDLSGEYLAHAVQRLLDEGAKDAWHTAITMKKGRPAVVLSALIEPEQLATLGQVLLDETGSLGFRSTDVTRHESQRTMGAVDVDGHSIRIKHSNATHKAEFDDVAEAARQLNVPARAARRPSRATLERHGGLSVLAFCETPRLKIVTNDRLYFKQLLSGRDFAPDDEFAKQMMNFVYLIGDRETREAVIIDPAYDPAGILDVLAADEMNCVGMLGTHYHADHVGGSMMGLSVPGAAEMLQQISVPLHLQADEAEYVKKVTGLADSDLALHQGSDSIMVGEIEIELLHTPGHTPGSQSFLVDNRLVAGDTLFLQGCGRTDLPGGNPEQLYHSLTKVLANVPDDAVLFPGHQYSPEPCATMAHTRASNMVFAPKNAEQWMAMFG